MDPAEIRLIRKIRPSPIEWEPFKAWERLLISIANCAVNLDSCGDIHCALGSPFSIENRRNW
jgi:hypothetical protein